jgi:DNA-binding CsgD family transcriptional regulator
MLESGEVGCNMVRLRQGDLERVLTVVRGVATARDPDEFARASVEQLSEVIPSDVITMNEVDPSAGRTVFTMQPETFPIPPGSQRRLADMADQHPLIHHTASTGDGSARRISDFWTREEFHASPIYRLLYQPMGIEFQMAVALPASRPIHVGIVLNRHDSDFSDRDRDVLNVLRPHLVQAWFSARDQAHLRMLVNAATDATVDRGVGLIVLSDPPHELTPGALVSLYRYFGRPSRTSPFPARVDQWLNLQAARLEVDASPELPKPLRAETETGHIVLRFLPSQVGHTGALLMHDVAGQPHPLNLQALGLTAREAEIVDFVMKGESNAAIGGALHVSPGTVKKHLDNIYTKLGVHSRGRLTAFVRDALER